MNILEDPQRPTLAQGSIYLASLPNYDPVAKSEYHRVIVVSIEPLNRGNSCLVVPLTTQRRATGFYDLVRVEYHANQFPGIDRDCCAHGDFLVRVLRHQLVAQSIGSLSDESLQELLEKVCNVFMPIPLDDATSP